MCTACHVGKYVPQDRYMLKGGPEFKGNTALSDGDLYEISRTRPNRAIFFVYKFYLRVYNTGGD